MRLSVATLALLFVLVFLIPVAYPSDPMLTAAGSQLAPPSSQHLLGTDLLGRDVLSRVLYGGQRTLLIAFASTLLAAVPALSLGMLAASEHEWLKRSLMIVLSAALSLPSLLFALVIITLLKSGALQLVIATALPQIAPFALIVRTAVISLRSESYIEAAHALGAPKAQILYRHIFPNLQPIVLTYMGITFVYSLLNSAALSFLGLGGEPGIPDWGVMLAEGRAAFRVAPWIAFAPGTAITLTVISMNAVIDRLVGSSN